MRAQLCEIRGDWPAGRADLEVIAKLAPASHAGAIAESEIALGDGRFDDAVAAATRAIEMPGGGDGHDYYRRAVARYSAGHREGAEADADKAESLASTDPMNVCVHAMTFAARGRMRSAADKVIAGLRGTRRSPHLVSLLVYFAARVGDLERARALDEQARRERKAHERAFLGLSPYWTAMTHAEGEAGTIARSITGELDIDAVAPKTPAASVLQRKRAEERFAKGEVEGAFADTGQAIADDPLDGAARLLNARCFIALGHPDAAAHTLELVDVLSPQLARDVEKLIGKKPKKKRG